MPVFKDHDDQGQLLQTRDEPLSEHNLARYIQENGLEKAMGYLECLEDITKEVEKFFYKKVKDYEVESSPSTVKNHAKLFYAEKLTFIQFAKSSLEVLTSQNKQNVQNDLLKL